MNVTDYIRPICLPSQGFVDPVDGDILELSGWGRPSDGKSHFRDSRVNQFRKKIVGNLLGPILLNELFRSRLDSKVEVSLTFG